jgi:hypothetical protein
MAAHSGECAPLTVLQRKFPDLPDVRTPDQFIAFVKTKGRSATVSTVESTRGRAVLVEVPEDQLSLTFVTGKVCATPEQKP